MTDKCRSLELHTEERTTFLNISTGYDMFTFELNSDQVLVLMKQALDTVWYGYKLVPRD